jgi:AraC-like DNA-binding protein
MADPPTFISDPTWIQHLVREFQILAGHLEWSDDATVSTALHTIVNSISPRTRAEELLVLGLLAQSVLRWQHRCHVSLFNCQCCVSVIDKWMPDDVRARLGLYVTRSNIVQPTILALKAKQLIDEHYSEPIEVSRIAREVGTSRRRLEREFSHSYGDSVHQYMIRVRVRQAIALLTHGDAKIESIATTSGFTNRASLYRALRRLHFGTPSQIRCRAVASVPVR